MLSVDDVRFFQTPHGSICIEFADPLYARAGAVFFDPSSRHVSGLIEDSFFYIGTLPETMTAYMGRGDVILAATHPNGQTLVLSVPVLTYQ